MITGTNNQRRLAVTSCLILAGCLLITSPAGAQGRPAIADLQARIAALEGSSVQALDGYLELDTSDPARPAARFTGVNVQIVNGAGSTPTVNGLGNLIVGYDETRTGTPTPLCSNGTYVTEQTCTGAGHVWSTDHKSGSHNVVVGRMHNYSRTGGLVAGEYNTINGVNATVTGGTRGIASGSNASVSGGRSGTASGSSASVNGGTTNTASNTNSSVTGGSGNTASADSSTVSGGANNSATSFGSSVSGGTSNTAAAGYASVSGGSDNRATGIRSSVSGGNTNTASGGNASVSGGLNRTASGSNDWVAGSLSEDQ